MFRRLTEDILTEGIWVEKITYGLRDIPLQHAQLQTSFPSLPAGETLNSTTGQLVLSPGAVYLLISP